MQWLLFRIQSKKHLKNKLDSEQDLCLPKKRYRIYLCISCTPYFWLKKWFKNCFHIFLLKPNTISNIHQSHSHLCCYQTVHRIILETSPHQYPMKVKCTLYLLHCLITCNLNCVVYDICFPFVEDIVNKIRNC